MAATPEGSQNTDVGPPNTASPNDIPDAFLYASLARLNCTCPSHAADGSADGSVIPGCEFHHMTREQVLVQAREQIAQIMETSLEQAFAEAWRNPSMTPDEFRATFTDDSDASAGA